MKDWIAIAVGAIINVALTIVLALVFFPLFFLGPIMGGFVAAYLVRDEYESGLIHGALAGVIGGLFIGILSLLSVWVLALLFGVLLSELGIALGAIGTVVVIFLTILAMLIFGVLSAIGGSIGEYVQSAGRREYEYEEY
ncbi:DUF5518 domain-containing protein [Methanobacterium oryzae]|uniref:DUF5518 domain-containing protein n=1 Tax=Methanobacterium oryzae TaxID=69540 RepID=UPI003D243A3A